MRWTLLLAALVLFFGCGKDDAGSSDGYGSGDGGSATEKPAQPDPAEVERQRVEKERQANLRKEQLKAEQKKLKAELSELKAKQTSLKTAHAAEKAGLPDKRKLRTTLQGLIRDLGSKRGIYETDKRRLDELEKDVQTAATGEIKELKKQISAKDREYNDLLSGAKAERANADLGIAEETQVQKEIRTLREAKQKWFDVTRDTRRGKASAKGKATSTFRSWCNEDELRKAVIGKALPKGKSAAGYDFSELDFYLYMELLEDTLDRQNVAEEKKTLSDNDKKLVILEKELDALNDKLAEKMTEGGGSLERYSSINARIGREQAEAEGLARQVEQMREVYNELDKTVERNEKVEYELEMEIEKKEKRLKALARGLK